MRVLIALFIATMSLAAQADYTYSQARDLFNKLPEAQATEAVGKWKMVAYAHTKKSPKSAPGGILVQGHGPHAQELVKTIKISVSEDRAQIIIKNTDHEGTSEVGFSELIKRNGELPQPELSKRKRLHCKSLQGKGLLCKERGISSGSVYLACLVPMEENGLSVCDIK